MNEVSKPCPIKFSRQFTSEYLQDIKKTGIHGSWYSVMERILSRHHEMEHVFLEIANAPSVTTSRTCSAFRLIHEAIWNVESSFSPCSIKHAKAVRKELSSLHDEIPKLAYQLDQALRRQRELVEQEGLRRDEYLGCAETITRAAENNGHFNSFIKDKLNLLATQFDGKYWPEPEDLVCAIGEFEREQPLPESLEHSDSLLESRKSIIKGFVVGFDDDIAKTYQIPRSFKFSNSAMATIANIALNLPEDGMATEENVRLVRHRVKKKA